MSLRRLSLVVTLAFLLPASSRAGEPVSIAVMEFASKGGVKQEQMDALSDMLANEIEDLGEFRVIGKSDIRSMLDLEEHKQRLSGCDDQACLVEIGGALGVRWVAVGNVSLFGDTFLMNLKIIDVTQAKVAGRVSRSITGGESMLISELPGAAWELLKSVTDLEELVKAGAPVAKKTEPGRTAPIREEAGAGWFSRSTDRQGRFFVFVRSGPGGFAPGNLSTGDRADLQDEGALGALESGRSLFRVIGGGGYNIFEWLAISAWVSYLEGQGTGWYQDCEPEVCEDAHFEGNLRRKRTALEAGLEVRAAWPLDFWIEPVAFLSMGSSWMDDYTPGSYFPDDEQYPEFEHVPTDGIGLLLDTGLGVDFYLYPNWRVNLRVYWMFRRYGTVRGDGFKLDASLWTHGVAGALGTAWIF
jgi:hypothetical protein